MKRTILGLTLVFFAALAAPASAGTLKSIDAKFEAIGHAFETKKGMPVSVDKANCRRTSPTSFRCQVAVTVETRWKLSRCQMGIKVTNDPELKATTTSRRCEEPATPYLSNGAAWKKAMKLVDPGYRSNDFLSRGGSFGRVSKNRFYFQFNWGNEKENCIQEIKVALVNGSVVGNAGEAICTPTVAWPRSAASAPDLIWQKALPSGPI